MRGEWEMRAEMEDRFWPGWERRLDEGPLVGLMSGEGLARGTLASGPTEDWGPPLLLLPLDLAAPPFPFPSALPFPPGALRAGDAGWKCSFGLFE
jgi:hypothetical protein